MIKLENVSKVYKGDVVALRNITCEIQKGEFVFLVGPSGAGKSTVVKLMLREEKPTRGEIWVAGKRIECRYVDGPVGVQSRNFSNDRIYTTGWRSKYDLRDGIAKTYPWIEQQVREASVRSGNPAAVKPR